MLVIFNQSGSLFNIDYQNDSFSQGDNNVHTIDVIVDEQGFKNGRYNCYIQFLREGETEPSPKLIMANKIIAYNDVRHSGFSLQMASEWYTAIAGVLKATIEIKEYSDDTLVSNKAYGVVNIPINESVSSDTGTTITDEEYNSMVSLINTKVGNSGSQNIEGYLSVDDGISTGEVNVGDITYIDGESVATKRIYTELIDIGVSNLTEIDDDGISTNEISVGPNDQVLINENGIATIQLNTQKVGISSDSIHLGGDRFAVELVDEEPVLNLESNNATKNTKVRPTEIETPIVRTNQIYNSNGNHVYSSQEDMTGNTDGIMGFGSEECEVRIRASGRPKIDVNGTYKEIATLDDISGVNGNYATLDENGKVPSSQLPGYVDDVVEYTSLSEFPATGESGKIYLATSTNKSYRWSGTQYVEIASSIALGETSSTAYPGNKGKANADAISELQSNKADVSSIPTKVSELENDSGYLTEHQDISGKADKTEIPTKVSELENDSGFLTAVPDITDIERRLTMVEDDNITQESAIINLQNTKANKTELFSKDYNDLTNKPVIPTKVSELTNDSNYSTENYVDTKVAALINSAPETLDTLGELAEAFNENQEVVDALNESIANKADKTELFSKNYNDLTNKPTIPTRTSQLTNDSGFLTQHQDLSNYATKNELPTKTSQLTNDSGYITLANVPSTDLTGYATEQWVQNKGYLTEIPESIEVEDIVFNDYNKGITFYPYDAVPVIYLDNEDMVNVDIPFLFDSDVYIAEERSLYFKGYDYGLTFEAAGSLIYERSDDDSLVIDTPHLAIDSPTRPVWNNGSSVKQLATLDDISSGSGSSGSGTGTSSDDYLMGLDDKTIYISTNSLNPNWQGTDKEIADEFSAFFDCVVYRDSSIVELTPLSSSDIVLVHSNFNNEFYHFCVDGRIDFKLGDRSILIPGKPNGLGEELWDINAFCFCFNSAMKNIASGTIVITHPQLHELLSSGDAYIDGYGDDQGEAYIILGGKFPEDLLVYFDKRKNAIYLEYCKFGEY